MSSSGLGGRKRLASSKRRSYPKGKTWDRSTDIEVEPQLAEIERVAAELVRARYAASDLNAEENRQITEEIRLSAELQREIAEQERSRAELERETAEKDRTSFEKRRKNDERTRAIAEVGRADAEKLRAATEEARKAAEDLRRVTEQARQTSEMMRNAYRDQIVVFNEIRKTTLDFDQAAREYREMTEELKRKRARKRAAD